MLKEKKINTDGLDKILLESHLKMSAYSWLHLEHEKAFDIKGIELNVYCGTFCYPRSTNVADAFVITGGGLSQIYNRQNYPAMDDALASHVGKLVLDGRLRLVNKRRGKQNS